MTLKETILQEALTIFQREGLKDVTAASIPGKLNISPATYAGIFTDMNDLVKQVIAYDLEKQTSKQNLFLAKSPNAVDAVMRLLQDGIQQINKVNPLYYQQLQQFYPAAWQIALNHLHAHSVPQLHGIINQGIVEGNFRRDINLELVTKIILEQVNMIVNPMLFPPDRYNLAEVFRSIFLYYMRGLCTDAGAKQAEHFFANNQL
jgi:hypothetical protein